MKAIDVVRAAMESGDKFFMSLIQDMSDAPMTSPTPRGGNHPLWVAGHLAHTEGELLRIIIGEPNPLEHWGKLFGGGTEPMADASKYPSMDEVLNAYRERRAANMNLLERIGDGGMDQTPKAAPTGAEHIFSSMAKTYLAIAMHQMNHSGQITDARRAAGRKPLFG